MFTISTIETASRVFAIADSSKSSAWERAFFRSVFTLDYFNSIGSKSGEYGGKYIADAPRGKH